MQSHCFICSLVLSLGRNIGDDCCKIVFVSSHIVPVVMYSECFQGLVSIDVPKFVKKLEVP